MRPLLLSISTFALLLSGCQTPPGIDFHSKTFSRPPEAYVESGKLFVTVFASKIQGMTAPLHHEHREGVIILYAEKFVAGEAKDTTYVVELPQELMGPQLRDKVFWRNSDGTRTRIPIRHMHFKK